MSASDITDYSSEVEELFIRYMISKPDLYVRCKGILRAEYFDDKQIKYTTTILQGKKDQDKLIYPKVIKIAQKENHVELFVTYFSGSLL